MSQMSRNEECRADVLKKILIENWKKNNRNHDKPIFPGEAINIRGKLIQNILLTMSGNKTTAIFNATVYDLELKTENLGFGVYKVWFEAIANK